MIFRSHLGMSRVDYPLEQPTSFECLISKLAHGNKQIIFINIYRPPSSSLVTFFQEFPALLEFFISSPSEIVITGNFNIHVDTDCTNSVSFSDSVLTPFALSQHVHFPIHDEGHILDLIDSRSDSTLVQDISHHDPGLSDHEAISFKFSLPV